MIGWILVFIGGGAGSMLRYYLSQRLNFDGTGYIIFPYGTIISNVISCFILGLLVQKQFSQDLPENYKLLLATGFCGGFSTFSTFAYEIYIYLHNDQLVAGLGYTCLSLVLGMVALILGIKLCQFFI